MIVSGKAALVNVTSSSVMPSSAQYKTNTSASATANYVQQNSNTSQTDSGQNQNAGHNSGKSGGRGGRGGRAGHSSLQCYICQKFGHVAADCWHKPSTTASPYCMMFPQTFAASPFGNQLQHPFANFFTPAGPSCNNQSCNKWFLLRWLWSPLNK